MSSRRVRVSVCVMTSAADVEACVAGGADAVGVLVGLSHAAADEVSAGVAAELLGAVPPYVGRYLVTHLVEVEALLALVDRLPIDTLQVHGDASPSVLAVLRNARPGLRMLKAIHVGDGREQRWRDYVEVADALLLDSIDLAAGRIGGTGKVHDWTVSAEIAAACPLPVILAGGLTPSNVATAIDEVRPWAVNVNTGVETDGRKDAARVRAFVSAARSGAEELAAGGEEGDQHLG